MRLIKTFDLKFVKFHGCALNVKSVKPSSFGMRMFKPWKIATDCDEIIHAFQSKLCTRDHDHAQCRGVDAKKSEDYSYDYVACLHEAFKKHVVREQGGVGSSGA